jgi:F-type H+-transporting ATPase subunit delta
MNQGRVSASYAKALLDWSVEKELSKEIYADCEKLHKFLQNNRDFYLILQSPVLSKPKKRGIITTLISEIAPSLLDFINIIAKNGREKQLENILLVYQKLYREKFGIIRSQVESANALSEVATMGIQKFLEKTYSKSVELEFKVNPALIGGFVLTIDDNLLDKSVKGEIEQLRKKFIG